MRREERSKTSEVETQFLRDHPEIARALELFEMSWDEYQKAIAAQHPVVTYSATSTEARPRV